MAAGKNGRQGKFDDAGLAEDHLADGLADLGKPARHLVELADDVFFCFADIGHDPYYSCRRAGNS